MTSDTSDIFLHGPNEKHLPRLQKLLWISAALSATLATTGLQFVSNKRTQLVSNVKIATDQPVLRYYEVN
ncbi:MAG: hypothetical protein WA323_07760 [Candidatus Nitrosopolaris sp.]|jgi:hypothetical protein